MFFKNVMFGWIRQLFFGEKDFWILIISFWYFIIVSAWKKVWPFIRSNFNPRQPKMLGVKFGWNWPNGSRKDILILLMFFFFFCNFFIISRLKRLGIFLWTNLNSHHPMMLCAKFCLNWINGSGDENFSISFKYFGYLENISV